MIPILIAGLIAVLLPASQDIVAWLTRQPKTGIALLLGIVALAILIPAGERTVNDFIYFQF